MTSTPPTDRVAVAVIASKLLAMRSVVVFDWRC